MPGTAERSRSRSGATSGTGGSRNTGRPGKFMEELHDDAPSQPPPEKEFTAKEQQLESASRGGQVDKAFDPPRQNVILRYIFILFVLVYIGLSGYVAARQLMDPASGSDIAEAAARQGSKTVEARAKGKGSGQDSASEGGNIQMGGLGNDWFLKLFASIALALGSSTAAFFVAIFYPDWLFHLSAGVLVLSGGSAVAVVLWNIWALEIPTPASQQLVGPFVAALAAGVIFTILFHSRLGPTRTMLKSVRLLIKGHHTHFYLLVFGSTVLQVVLLLWTTYSVVQVIIRYQPGSSACSTEDCGLMLPLPIIFYVVVQLWISGTLSDILITVLAGTFYSRKFNQDGDTSVRSHLVVQIWALLGTRARNAVWCDTIEYACWQYTNLDRIPIVNKLIACFLSKKIGVLSRMLESYNRYIGVVAATHRYKYDYIETKAAAYPFIKRGQEEFHREGTEGMTPERQGLGRYMGAVQTRLRTERDGHEKRLKPSHWHDGLGAFLESHQTKSVLVIAAAAATMLTGAFIYVITFATSESEPNGVDVFLVVWSLYLTYSTAYHLMVAVEAGVSTVQAWIYNPHRPDIRKGGSELKNYLDDDLDVGGDGFWRLDTNDNQAYRGRRRERV